MSVIITKIPFLLSVPLEIFLVPSYTFFDELMCNHTVNRVCDATKENLIVIRVFFSIRLPLKSILKTPHIFPDS